VVTAKGSAATGDGWRTFRPHLLWLGVALTTVGAGLLLGHDYPTLYVWAGLTALICAAGPVHVAVRRAIEALPVRVARMRSVLANRRLGDVLVARGALTAGQRRALLDLQATREEGWIRLGDLAVAEGYLTEEQLTEALDRRPVRIPLPRRTDDVAREAVATPVG
jgi:hypothetical protein